MLAATARNAVHYAVRMPIPRSWTGRKHRSIPRMTDAEKTVLLIEDNEDNRTVYRTILEHFG